MRKFHSKFAGLALSALSFAAAIFMLTPLVVSAKATITIAAAGPYTGDLSKIGLDALNAIKMAIDEVNKDGGIAGRKVELTVGDDGADPAKALLVAEKMGQDRDILGVVGPMNSSCVAASLPAYQGAGLSIITPSAGNSDLAERGFSVFHRLCSRDDSQGNAIARFIADKLKASSVYIVDDKTTYGQSLADHTQKYLKSEGVKEINRGHVSSEDKDMSPLLTRIKSEKPDVIFMGLSSPSQAAALVKQAAGLGIKATFVGGNAQKEKDQYVVGSSGLAEGSFVTSVGKDIHDVPSAKDFITKFEKKHGAISAFSSQAYEATGVLLAAIEKAIKDNRGKDVDRAQVAKALSDIEDYKGILGFPISFNKKGDLVGVRVYILKVTKGDFEEAASYASTK